MPNILSTHLHGRDSALDGSNLRSLNLREGQIGEVGIQSGVETVHVDEAAWQRYLLREGLIQTIFPDLDLADRELVMNAARGRSE